MYSLKLLDSWACWLHPLQSWRITSVDESGIKKHPSHSVTVKPFFPNPPFRPVLFIPSFLPLFSLSNCHLSYFFFLLSFSLIFTFPFSEKNEISTTLISSSNTFQDYDNVKTAVLPWSFFKSQFIQYTFLFLQIPCIEKKKHSLLDTLRLSGRSGQASDFVNEMLTQLSFRNRKAEQKINIEHVLSGDISFF